MELTVKSIDLDLLQILNCNVGHDFPILNEFYFPNTSKLDQPLAFFNNYSRKNKKYQKYLKLGFKSAKKIIEIGCGSGDFTIPLANAFPDKEFLAIEPSGTIIYAMLKRDLHNLVKSKKDYIRLVKKYIPEDFCENDGYNHPSKFNRLDNLRFLPISSKDLTCELFDSDGSDFTFAAFVANNHYFGHNDLSKFIGSIACNLSPNSKLCLLDGQFESRSISAWGINNACFRFNLNYRNLGDDHYTLSTISKYNPFISNILSKFL